MTPEQMSQRYGTIAKWGLIGIGAAIIAPYALLAIGGLVGVAIFVGVGLVLVNVAPVIAMRAANWKLKALKAEAERNPIETLQRDYVTRQEELVMRDNEIVAFETEVSNYADQVVILKQEYPDESARFEEIEHRVRQGLAGMKLLQAEARAQLEHTKKMIRKAETLYKMALSAQRVTKMSRSVENEIYADIKQQVAFDSVRTSLNGAFANLNLAMERRTVLPAAPMKVIGGVKTGA